MRWPGFIALAGLWCQVAPLPMVPSGGASETWSEGAGILSCSYYLLCLFLIFLWKGYNRKDYFRLFWLKIKQNFSTRTTFQRLQWRYWTVKVLSVNLVGSWVAVYIFLCLNTLTAVFWIPKLSPLMNSNNSFLQRFFAQSSPSVLQFLKLLWCFRIWKNFYSENGR